MVDRTKETCLPQAVNARDKREGWIHTFINNRHWTLHVEFNPDERVEFIQADLTRLADVIEWAIHNGFNPKEEVAVTWSVKDVQDVRNDLTEEQAMKVLNRAVDKHDADLGINWTTLEETAGYLFPENAGDEEDRELEGDEENDG